MPVKNAIGLDTVQDTLTTAKSGLIA